MRLIFSSVVLLMAVAGAQADPVIFLSDTRSVSVSIQASSPLATSPQAGATNCPATPFNDPHLNSSCSINWQEVNGWTAAPSTGSASQDVSFSANQITLANNLSVNVGGDPFGSHFPTPASGTVRAETIFEVGFFVASLTGYDYTFDFSPSSTLTTASLTLSSGNHGTQQLFGTSGTPVSGLLAPDNYILTFDFASTASGDQVGNDFSTIQFNFTPTPEPTAGALLMLGFITLGLWRRKNAK